MLLVPRACHNELTRSGPQADAAVPDGMQRRAEKAGDNPERLEAGVQGQVRSSTPDDARVIEVGVVDDDIGN